MNASKALRLHQEHHVDAFHRSLTRVQRGRLVGDLLGLAGDFASGKDLAARAEIRPTSGWRRAAKSVAKKPPEKKKISIWSPRAATSDSRDKFDTDTCFDRMLEVDWSRALRHGLGSYIVSPLAPALTTSLRIRMTMRLSPIHRECRSVATMRTTRARSTRLSLL
jgi:hypothetical protein